MVALAEARREAIARNFIVEEENAKILTGMGDGRGVGMETAKRICSPLYILILDDISLLCEFNQEGGHLRI
jgi:hypothetical protein